MQSKTLLGVAFGIIVLIFGGLAVLFLNSENQIQNTDQCIITLFGEQYDVSEFRTQHSGGNVFVCGSDMTEEYEAQHGSDLTRLEEYKIN